jgi:uncharacterized protein YdaU (DUF1376 family)
MHYYKHNIGDYRKDTSHLTLLEHGIYRQLLDSYYLDETPLCNDLAKLMRSHSVRSADEQQALQNVLTDFFELTENGYIHKRCDELIAEYHGKSESARNSANARWGNKNKDSKPRQSKRNANALQTQSEGNANHKPVTNNHKPVVKTTTKIELPEWLPEKAWVEWVEYRRSTSKPMSQLASTKFLNQLETFVKDGYDPVKLIDLAIASGWRTVYARDDAKTKAGSKPEWMKGLTYVRT